MRRLAKLLGLSSIWLATALSAHAADEIQVYNAEIAKVGQWTAQLHLNYAFSGRKEPEFEGGLLPDRALNGTPEFAYGVTEWWEIGFYLPFAVDRHGQAYSNAGKVRTLFVSPHAAERNVFYGVNFEFAYSMPQFSETKWNIEVRPIFGVRQNGYEFIINPIVDIGLGVEGNNTFAPAARFARELSKDFAVGVEYYTDLGPMQYMLPFKEQQHNVYGVVDFKIGKFDINAGVGYGLTPGSDRLVAKIIIGTDLNEGLMTNVSSRSSRRAAEILASGVR